MITLTKKLLICLFAAGVLFIAGLVFIAPRIFQAYEDRLCRSNIRDQVKIPADWRVEQCTLGDWSGDFDAKVSVPAGQSPKQSLDDFRRLNTTVKSDTTISVSSAPIVDDERRLSIDRDDLNRNYFTISLIGPK